MKHRQDTLERVEWVIARLNERYNINEIATAMHYGRGQIIRYIEYYRESHPGWTRPPRPTEPITYTGEIPLDEWVAQRCLVDGYTQKFVGNSVGRCRKVVGAMCAKHREKYKPPLEYNEVSVICTPKSHQS